MMGFLIPIALVAASPQFPSYFNDEQRSIGARIIDHATASGEDPYVLMAIAWKESRIEAGKVSSTGDVGIFQINWKFWGSRTWGYRSYDDFVEDMNRPELAAAAAIAVLQEMRRYKACQGDNLMACYNGGPSWMLSSNVDKIAEYARDANVIRRRYAKQFKGWKKRAENEEAVCH